MRSADVDRSMVLCRQMSPEVPPDFNPAQSKREYRAEIEATGIKDTVL